MLLQAIRKVLRIPVAKLSNADIAALFGAIDTTANGRIDQEVGTVPVQQPNFVDS